MTRDKVIELASDMDEFLAKLEKEHGRVTQFEKDHPGVMIMGPEDDFVYAEAVIDWNAQGCREHSIFTSPDPYLILYRKELTSRYGLKVMTYDEAEEYKARLARSIHFEDLIATGDPEASPEYNLDPKKRAEAFKVMGQWAETLKKKYPSLN